MGTEIRCGGLLFTSKFDSGNLAAVEKVDRSDSDSDGATNDPYGCRMTPDYEFNVWTKPDCGGTTFENGNRSWFYFGIRGNNPNKVIKINIVNLNRQGKLYSQGMSPLVKVLPYRPKWDRIRERATYQVVDGQFTLSFLYRFSEQKGGTTYFAFCYPWSYSESQEQLERIDEIFKGCADLKPGQAPDNAIYCHRELLCNSLDKRRIDLLTITSCKGMCTEREPRLENLFPDKGVPRAHTFKGKRVYYVSSRVHPGETPASFVFNGFLEFALRENDARAQALRDKYILKLVPMLNPDGVYRGHYRTDQRGVNLNRLYLLPDIRDHPSIYASRSLLLFYHHFYRRENEPPQETIVKENGNGDAEDEQRMLIPTSDGDVGVDANDEHRTNAKPHKKDSLLSMCFGKSKKDSSKEAKFVPFQGDYTSIPPRDSGIAFYVDLHGHASKRGCFIYGNHLENEEDQVDNLLFPKLIAVNSAHFDFNGCNFTERNMYLKDKRDGMSKEGSGRVAIFKTLGIIHSYTLECNYNTGRTVNCIPPAVPNGKATPPPPAGFPPKYTPEIFEGVGRAMAIAALDFYGWNPWSRLKHSEFTSLDNLRHWMTRYVRSSRGNPILPRKMTNRIPVNTGLSNGGTGSSGGSSNGNGRNGNTRFSGNGDRKNGQVPTYARSSSLTNANGPYGKKAVTVTKNQLSPFKSVSSSNVGNQPAGNRFTNRQKNLIRVTVNNSSRHSKTAQTPQDQTNKGFVGSKVKNGRETPVTLSFTTTNSRATTSPAGASDHPRDPTPTSLPSAVENLAFQMNEKLMLSMGLLDNPRILPPTEGAATTYGHPPGFNLPPHDHPHHRMRVVTPPVHHRGLPRSVRNNIIMQSLTQEYNVNEADFASSDPRTVRFLNQKQASFLLGKSAALASQAQKSLIPNQPTQGNPRLHENGFISPQVCKAPSIPSRGKSALSLYTSSTPVSQFFTPSEMRNGAITPSSSLHALGTPQPVTLTFNGTNRHLPLTVTRMPIVSTKDENSNYVAKSSSGLLQPTSRPTIVNFRGKNGLVSENKSNSTLKPKEDASGNKRISRLRPPRRISSGHGEGKIRRAAPTHLSPKAGIDKETRYLKATKRALGHPHHTSEDGAMLSGEAVQLSPRVTKSFEELPNIAAPVTPTLDPGVHVTTSSASPTAINANLMMMNCMPGMPGAPPADL